MLTDVQLVHDMIVQSCTTYCKHIRSAVVGLAHALGRKHMAGLCCVIIVQNKSKLALTEGQH